MSRVFHESFKDITRVSLGCLKGVSRKFQGCFKKVVRVFQESFKGVSRKIKGVFRKNRAFERSFKGSFKCA